MKTQDFFETTSCPNTLGGRLRTICTAGLLPLLLLLPPWCKPKITLTQPMTTTRSPSRDTPVPAVM